MLLDRIELFISVAKYHNLAKTARQMHVSSSSVCQRLKSLENDFGTKLYKKTKEGIELTDAGRTFLSGVTGILGELESLKKTLSSKPDNGRQGISVGGNYNPSVKHLPMAIAAFKKTHPNITVTFWTGSRAHIEKCLRDFDVDIALVQSPSKTLEFHLEPFAVDTLVFFAHPAHPLAKKKGLELSDLAETALIVREGTGASYKMLKQLKARGLKKLNVALRCGTPDAVKAAVKNKMGIGMLFTDTLQEELARKDFKVLKFSGVPELLGHSYILFNKKKPLSPAANHFLTLLRSRKSESQNDENRDKLSS